MANEEGYAQVWESSNPDPEAVRNYGPETAELDHGQKAYEVETEEFDQAYLLDMEDSGITLVGYTENNEIVFAGTRTSARDAYWEFNHQTGSLIDSFNGVENFEPEDHKNHTYSEVFDEFYTIAGQNPDIVGGLEGVEKELDPDSSVEKTVIVTDGGVPQEPETEEENDEPNWPHTLSDDYVVENESVDGTQRAFERGGFNGE